jgi:hypothetical protein
MRTPAALCLIACLAVFPGCSRAPGDSAPAPAPTPAPQPAPRTEPVPSLDVDRPPSPTLAQPIEWKEFIPQQAGFKIRFPRLPEKQVKTEDIPEGKVQYVAFVALAPEHDGAYSLAVIDVPEALARATPDETHFAEGALHLTRATTGRILEEKAIRVDGRPGKELRLLGAGPAGRTTFYARLVRSGARSFQLFAAFPEGKENLELARRYLDSFTLVDE